MSRAQKAPERQSVSFALTDEQLKDLDQEIAILVGAIPGAKLARAAFVEQIVLADIARRKEARAAAADLREGPTQQGAPAPAFKGRKVAS